MSAVRAKYQNGVLTPLDPLDLEEGAEVMVSVEGAANGARADSFNIERLVALQEEAFGDKILPGDGTEFIREARESRSVS